MVIIKRINQWLFIIILSSLVFAGCPRGDPCQLVMHGSKFNSPENNVFRSLFNLPNDIPHLPLSQGEDFPLEYYLHESVPEEYRNVFYEKILRWNRSLEREIFIIKGIDHNEIDPIHNRKDQKNVIYWFSEDQLRDTLSVYNMMFPEDVLSTAYNFPMINVEDIDDALSYLKISDSDIVIREEFITDIEFVRFFLLKRLRFLGVEADDTEDIETLQNKIVTYWQAMDLEDARKLAIRELEYKRDQFLQGRIYTEEIIDSLNERIELYATSVKDIHLALIIQETLYVYRNIDPEKLRRRNVILSNTILHELGHGLGLGHYNGSDHPLMSNTIVRNLQDLMPSPKSIDDYVYHGLSCAYDF